MIICTAAKPQRGSCPGTQRSNIPTPGRSNTRQSQGAPARLPAPRRGIALEMSPGEEGDSFPVSQAEQQLLTHPYRVCLTCLRPPELQAAGVGSSQPFLALSFPPPAQLEAVSSHPITWEKSPSPVWLNLLPGAAESDEVSASSSPTEAAPGPSAAPITPVLQPLPTSVPFSGHAPASQDLSWSEGPKTEPGIQGVQGDDPVPAPSGHPMADPSRDAGGLLGHLGHCWLVFSWYHPVPTSPQEGGYQIWVGVWGSIVGTQQMALLPRELGTPLLPMVTSKRDLGMLRQGVSFPLPKPGCHILPWLLLLGRGGDAERGSSHPHLIVPAAGTRQHHRAEAAEQFRACPFFCTIRTAFRGSFSKEKPLLVLQPT
ncbi:uncharacterized protein LOC128849318 [Cuculus canorus]|uniref:uncharacterized protein LOC128849318 n=1 Tax=Cuculus canorus TaxID=55661 RepID=UPI0023AA2E0D|nr:uncharacterized protein LOC128849318 [Cuculus canorus]